MGAGEGVRTGGNGARGRRGGRGRVCVRLLLFLPSTFGPLSDPAIFGWRGGDSSGGERELEQEPGGAVGTGEGRLDGVVWRHMVPRATASGDQTDDGRGLAVGRNLIFRHHQMRGFAGLPFPKWFCQNSRYNNAFSPISNISRNF